MNLANQRNCGAYLKPALAIAPNATPDAEVDGVYVDRTALNQFPLSCKLILAYSATLAEDETLTIAANIQDADDTSGTNVADYGTAHSAAVAATGGTGGSTETGVIELDNDLSGAKEALRAQATLTTSGTGTVDWAAVWVFGGNDQSPAS